MIGLTLVSGQEQTDLILHDYERAGDLLVKISVSKSYLSQDFNCTYHCSVEGLERYQPSQARSLAGGRVAQTEY